MDLKNNIQDAGEPDAGRSLGAAAPAGAPRYINRELSWLEFNHRVLEQARDSKTPLLERLKFLAIAASNLDEFFMVRVGGLHQMVSQGISRLDPAGMTPAGQLEAIDARARRMVEDLYACFHGALEPELARAGIARARPADLTEEQRRHCAHVFEREILPLVSPAAVNDSSALPLLASRTVHLGVRVRPQNAPAGRARFAVVPLSKGIGRLVTLPGERGCQFLLAEDLIRLFADRLFEGHTVVECAAFRMTRNADLAVREDEAGDLLAEMEAVLDARKRGDCVRLEISAPAGSAVATFLQKALRLPKTLVYRIDGPLDLAGFMPLCELPGHADLRYEPWQPQPSPLLPRGKAVMEVVANGPVLLYHPFESFEPVVRLIQEAADDRDVVAIKQILYRTSRSSPIVAALIRAAQQGKHVTVLVELKARFDEARNIEWAQELESAGVQVVYGVKGLKTHAKVLMVVRRDLSGLRRYVHFGTGNYNEITAHLYCDVSFFTAEEDLGVDATAFFNAVTGYSQPQRLRALRMAPISLREELEALIRGEIDRQRQGQKALIRAKVNSLADPELIELLYKASQEGVRVELNVRGICCLRPGVKGLSENISVVSIVDRFLEHARILHFGNGGKDRLFITTADWMGRNLDRRIELLVPVEDPVARARLAGILDVCLGDTANGWRLGPDGAWRRRGTGGKKRSRSQETLYRKACEAVKHAKRIQRTVFEVCRPAEV